MSDNTNSERALFEAAWRKEYNMPESAKFSPFVAGRYLATAVDDAFQGWRMARAAIDKGARQAAPEAPTLPHITNPDALEAGREYWLRDKKTGATKIRECQVDNGCRYFEARIWAEPINNQAMERWDIFGPLPVRTFGASTGPAPEAPATMASASTEVQAFADKLSAAQKPLPPDFAAVLAENAWELYQSDDRAQAPSRDAGQEEASTELILPPLPEKIATLYAGNYWTGLSSANPPGKPLGDVYTAEQVCQAQRDAYELGQQSQKARIMHLTHERDMARAHIDGRTAGTAKEEAK